MSETELKILEINIDEEIKKIKKLGFKKVWEGIIKEKVFDTLKKKLKKEKKKLRLRSAYGKVELAVKEKKEKHPFFKIRNEKETIVESFKETEEILYTLGFKCVAEREKKRISFKKDNIKIEIDKYPKAKPYLELEGKDTEIIKLLKDLNYPLERTTKKTAREVLKLYGLRTDKLKFKE